MPTPDDRKKEAAASWGSYARRLSFAIAAAGPPPCPSLDAPGMEADYFANPHTDHFTAHTDHFAPLHALVHRAATPQDPADHFAHARRVLEAIRRGIEGSAAAMELAAGGTVVNVAGGRRLVAANGRMGIAENEGQHVAAGGRQVIGDRLAPGERMQIGDTPADALIASRPVGRACLVLHRPSEALSEAPLAHRRTARGEYVGKSAQHPAAYDPRAHVTVDEYSLSRSPSPSRLPLSSRLPSPTFEGTASDLQRLSSENNISATNSPHNEKLISLPPPLRFDSPLYSADVRASSTSGPGSPARLEYPCSTTPQPNGLGGAPTANDVPPVSQKYQSSGRTISRHSPQTAVTFAALGAEYRVNAATTTSVWEASSDTTVVNASRSPTPGEASDAEAFDPLFDEERTGKIPNSHIERRSLSDDEGYDSLFDGEMDSDEETVSASTDAGGSSVGCSGGSTTVSGDRPDTSGDGGKGAHGRERARAAKDMRGASKNVSEYVMETESVMVRSRYGEGVMTLGRRVRKVHGDGRSFLSSEKTLGRRAGQVTSRRPIETPGYEASDEENQAAVLVC